MANTADLLSKHTGEGVRQGAERSNHSSAAPVTGEPIRPASSWRVPDVQSTSFRIARRNLAGGNLRPPGKIFDSWPENSCPVQAAGIELSVAGSSYVGARSKRGATLSDATGTMHRLPLILVADDDDDFREYICMTLSRGEYELLSVSDGAAAMDFIDTALLDPLEAHLPDLLITDIQMPCCSGLKVLAYAKFLPTIAITAFGDADTHAEARRCGANFVFDKPIDVRMLRRVVGALVH